ncbi:SIR2-like domain-containing protein [Chryseolinea serpens]|uniref:NAD(+) hydrolase ThsA n=1 Tax=Chryseolinea serpens TaxID=947013 RepID=A0A1M5K3N1_9BACT|nr:SIR2 family protein [Chryseolinea serpens]SHG47361.1 SIR2-like domain-containing protein [Chryseolinea serpens]
MKTTFDDATNEFINNFAKQMRDGNAAVFAGAGLSVASGYFDWKKLLEPIAKKLKLNIQDEHDLTALAQFFVDDRESRNDLTQILAEEFTRTNIVLSENHDILARLPIAIYWTTNYDNLIEQALRQAGKLADVKRYQADLAINIPKRDAIVYKMHGDISDLANTVLTKHEYEDYNLTRELFSNAFKADFVSRSMLFIGFSFTDPNLDYLISRIRTIQQKHSKTHYYFVRKDKDEKAHNRQKIRAHSLKQYGLRAIWVNEYDDVPDILKEIESRYLRTSIFFSGAAEEYGPFPNPVDFIQQLSMHLAKAGYKIFTGFGKNVGTHVLNGVLYAMIAENSKRLDKYITLRPFPMIGQNDRIAKETKATFRESIIKEAGIALFIFGNKLIDGKLLLSPGMKDEFEMALNAGLKVIPIPTTGYQSKELYDLVMNNFSDYYEDFPQLKEVFASLEQKVSSSEIIETVKTIIKTLNEY